MVLSKKETIREVNKFILKLTKLVNQIEEENIREYQEKKIMDGKKVDDCD